MSDTRFNNICMILGRRGSGKTDYLKGNPQHNLEGFLKLYIEKGLKLLIIDTIDHPSYRDIKVMPISKLHLWTKGVYRIFVSAEEIPALNQLINSLPNLWNTCLVYEDAYKHTFKSIDRSLIQLIADSKQKNIDIIFMYHSWMQAPPDLYRYIDLIECFKTKDHPEVRKTFMPGYYEEALKAWTEVMDSESPFAHKLIDTDL